MPWKALTPQRDTPFFYGVIIDRALPGPYWFPDPVVHLSVLVNGVPCLLLFALVIFARWYKKLIR